jgi:hypothetical protein
MSAVRKTRAGTRDGVVASKVVSTPDFGSVAFTTASRLFTQSQEQTRITGRLRAAWSPFEGRSETGAIATRNSRSSKTPRFKRSGVCDLIRASSLAEGRIYSLSA